MVIKIFELDEISIKYTPDDIYDSWESYMKDVYFEGVDEIDEDEFDYDAIGGNREFSPLDPLGDSALMELCRIEFQQLEDLHAGRTTTDEIEEQEEEMYSDDSYQPYMILDVGVRSAVMALLEIGAHPFSSCNGGSFQDEGYHAEDYPLIAMYGREGTLRLVESAARSAGCGLYSGMGAMVLYCDDIRKFISLAKELYQSISEQ